MNTKSRKYLLCGFALIILFALFTVLIKTVDVESVGVNGTEIGFATLNIRCHNATGVNMTLYNITDWLGLVPVFICMVFGVLGFIQLVKRKNLFKVDFDILILGVYYVIVVLCYLIFEMIPFNYRPILIDGFLECSYPSSTTLLVLSVIPTLVLQVNRRIKNSVVKRLITVISVLFSVFMVAGRLISGVHWVTDIVGSCILSAGLFFVYKGIICQKIQENYNGI